MPRLAYKPKGKMSPETRAKISAALKGHDKSPEHRARLAEAQTGKTYSAKSKAKMSQSHQGVRPWRKGVPIPSMRGDNHPKWKGDDVSYGALHSWVARHLGKPSTCEHCEKTELKGQSIHWANKSHEYKRELDDWLRLCVACHSEYDKLTRVGGENYVLR